MTRHRTIWQYRGPIEHVLFPQSAAILMSIVSSRIDLSIVGGAHACRSCTISICGHWSGVRDVGIVRGRNGAIVEAIIDWPGSYLVNRGLIQIFFAEGKAKAVVWVEVEDVHVASKSRGAMVVHKRGHVFETAARSKGESRRWKILNGLTGPR